MTAVTPPNWGTLADLAHPDGRLPWVKPEKVAKPKPTRPPTAPPQPIEIPPAPPHEVTGQLLLF